MPQEKVLMHVFLEIHWAVQKHRVVTEHAMMSIEAKKSAKTHGKNFGACFSHPLRRLLHAYGVSVTAIYSKMVSLLPHASHPNPAEGSS